MNPVDGSILPFWNRDQFNFKGGATFTLVVNLRSFDTTICKITGITREGPFTLKVVPTSDGAITTQSFRLPDLPIFLSASNAVTAVYKNMQYIDIALQINGDVMLPLMSGYVYSSKPICWPAATFESATPPEVGRINLVDSANPAAGAECTHAFASNKVYLVNNITVTLVTDANVANRRVHIRLLESSGGEWEFISSVDHAASLTRKYRFMAIGGAGTYSDDNDILVPIPDNLWVKGGSYITTETTNKQAGDDFGVMHIGTQEFIKDGA